MYKQMLLQMYKFIQAACENRVNPTKSELTFNEGIGLTTLQNIQTQIAACLGVHESKKYPEKERVNKLSPADLAACPLEENDAYANYQRFKSTLESLLPELLQRNFLWVTTESALHQEVSRLLTNLANYEKRLQATSETARSTSAATTAEQRLAQIEAQLRVLQQQNTGFSEQLILYEQRRHRAQQIIVNLDLGKIDPGMAQNLIEIFSTMGLTLPAIAPVPLPPAAIVKLPPLSNEALETWKTQHPKQYGQYQLQQCVTPATYMAIVQLLTYLENQPPNYSVAFHTAVNDASLAENKTIIMLVHQLIEHWDSPWAEQWAQRVQPVLNSTANPAFKARLGELAACAQYGDQLPRTYGGRAGTLTVLAKLLGLGRYVPANQALAQELLSLEKKERLEQPATSSQNQNRIVL